MVAPYLGGERHAEVLERARFRSKREIAKLIAEIDPRPEVLARIVPVAPAAPRPATHAAFAEALGGPVRSLPPGDRPEDWMPADRVEEDDGGTKRAPDVLADRELAEAERAIEGAWEARREAPPERPLRYMVQFTASQEYVDLLEEALDLLGYQKRAASLPEVQLRALRELVERLRTRKTGAARDAETSTVRGRDVDAAPARQAETSSAAAPARQAETSPRAAPARFAESRETEASDGAAPARVVEAEARASHAAAPARVVGSPDRSRYVPVAVRRAVWSRDGSRCAYIDPRGRRCSERRGLEVHHRTAHAFDGPATVANLELRCKAHNTVAAEQDFGRAYMDWIRGKRSA